MSNSSQSRRLSPPSTEASEPWLILCKEGCEIGRPVGAEWTIRQAGPVPDSARRGETIETIGPSDVKHLGGTELPP